MLFFLQHYFCPLLVHWMVSSKVRGGKYFKLQQQFEEWLELPLDCAMAMTPTRSTAANLAQVLSPISQNLLIEGWEGTGHIVVHLCQKLKGSHLAGLDMCPWTPQVLIMWRISILSLRLSCHIPSQWQVPCSSRVSILCWIPWWTLNGETASVSPTHQRNTLSWWSNISFDIKRGWRTYWEKRKCRVQSRWQ